MLGGLSTSSPDRTWQPKRIWTSTSSDGSTSTSWASSPVVRASVAASTTLPAPVGSLLVEMLQPYRGRVYGSGGMFVRADEFVRAHCGVHADISIYGQERVPTRSAGQDDPRVARYRGLPRTGVGRDLPLRPPSGPACARCGCHRGAVRTQQQPTLLENTTRRGDRPAPPWHPHHGRKRPCEGQPLRTFGGC